MGHFYFDDSRPPLVMARFVGSLTDEQFEEYIALLQQKLDSGQRTVLIIDALASDPRTEAQRRRQTQWMRANEDAVRAHTLGVALVIGSPLVRGVVSAYLWFQSMPFPSTVVDSVDDALAWAAEICSRNGMRGPESVVGPRR